MARAAAAQSARLRASPLELPPGRYTVILEPAAVLDLAGQMFGDFSATAIADGRSFLSDRIGKKLFGDNITHLRRCRITRCKPARLSMAKACRAASSTLVEKGVVRDVAYLPPGRRTPPASSPPATAFRCPTNSAKRP